MNHYEIPIIICQNSLTLNVHAPLKKLTRKERKQKPKPWLSKGILI